MRKPHISISWAVAVSLLALLVGAGCEGNNKPPMTPDGPEMDLDASAPPAVTAPSAAPTAPRTNPG